MPKKNLKKTASSRLTPLEIHRYIWADIWLPLSGRKTWIGLGLHILLVKYVNLPDSVPQIMKCGLAVANAEDFRQQ